MRIVVVAALLAGLAASIWALWHPKDRPRWWEKRTGLDPRAEGEASMRMSRSAMTFLLVFVFMVLIVVVSFAISC